MPSIRTRDIDILIPVPVKFDHNVDVLELVKDLGFVLDFRRPEGYVRLMHPELILEFLVPEKGRARGKPFDFPDLGINAQPLRFMEILIKNTVRLKTQNLMVTVPHPANFAIHTLIISSRRKDDKKEKDLSQAVSAIHALIDTGKGFSLREVFDGIPKNWQKAVNPILSDLNEERILGVLN